MVVNKSRELELQLKDANTSIELLNKTIGEERVENTKLQSELSTHKASINELQDSYRVLLNSKDKNKEVKNGIETLRAELAHKESEVKRVMKEIIKANALQKKAEVEYFFLYLYYFPITNYIIPHSYQVSPQH